MKSQTTAYKFALIAIFFWSTVATAFKISLQYLSAVQLVLYASISSFLILFAIVTYKKQLRNVLNYIKKSYLQIFILALINPFLYYLVLFKAYELLPAQEAQAINYTWALMLTYLSVIFLKQKLTINDIVAGIICYFGVLIISTKGAPFSLSFSNIDGVLLALLSTVLWSLYWITNTKTKADPLISVFANFLFSIPIIFIYAYFTGELSAIPDIRGIASSFYVGVFEMGITFLFWLNAMQYAQSTAKIANLIFLSPFISLIFIYFILGEEIYISTVIGLITIIAGLIIQQLKTMNTNSDNGLK